MLITNKTIICFRIPDEYKMAAKFKAANPDWVESETSQYVGFMNESAYAVETREENSECRKN